MTQDTGAFTAEPASSQAGQQSTAEMARDQAADVGQSARRAGQQVAGTAAEQAKQVAAETGRQAQNLVAQARDQAQTQASAQQQKAAGQLHALADELDAMASHDGQEGLATELAGQAAERVRGAASWLERHEPADLVGYVRGFARRRPGLYLFGAALAGVIAGRFTRGMTASAQPDSQHSQPPSEPATAPAADASVSSYPYAATDAPASAGEVAGTPPWPYLGEQP